MNIVEKIKALLAKAESTDNDHEASAYFEKAEALIVQHAVEDWQLSPAQREQVESRIIEVGHRRPDITLRNVITRHNGVQMVLKSPSRLGLAYVVGRHSDIAFCDSLYASLLLQRERELARAERPPHVTSTRSFNHSFRLAYALTVAERMETWKRRAEDASGPGTELVLRDRSKEVGDFIEINIGKTRNTAGPRATSAAGARSGAEAGARADISGGERNLAGQRPALGGQS